MLFRLLLVALTAASPIHHLPTNTTQTTTSTLRLLLTITTLEAFLYAQGCTELDPFAFASAGYDSTVYENICGIALEKAAIVMDFEGLLKALGQPSGGVECEYRFGHGSVQGLVETAREVGAVGVGAFLGGVQATQSVPLLQTWIASLATTEARHDAFLRAETGALPAPSIHDVSLPPTWAYNLIQKWIHACPKPLPYPIFPQLNSTTSWQPGHNQTDDAIDTNLTISLSWRPSEFAVEVSPRQPLYLAVVDNLPGAKPMILDVQRKTMNGTVHAGDAVIPGQFAGGVAFAALTTFVELNSVDDLVQYGTLAGPVEFVWS
ncbi:hypothetical protein M409DRAFT_24450 [Zasmidium cellare ATCC 36951]|uniref:Uncharacterized protein n=1 Tax=Zasmidium cellare ATCC 36951 TaxID=1080233 RepID=A0A6A6CCZ5_ZASCE|nr:uncharacterized protein M409DRAFT_24450 [Zasmidium cellare ATCC 36951]KAF2165064.1 hypothetical protein M409DRAFT_24450 [Zasmidium cellare ATCC 36951]